MPVDPGGVLHSFTLLGSLLPTPKKTLFTLFPHRFQPSALPPSVPSKSHDALNLKKKKIELTEFHNLDRQNSRSKIDKANCSPARLPLQKILETGATQDQRMRRLWKFLCLGGIEDLPNKTQTDIIALGTD